MQHVTCAALQDVNSVWALRAHWLMANALHHVTLTGSGGM